MSTTNGCRESGQSRIPRKPTASSTGRTGTSRSTTLATWSATRKGPEAGSIDLKELVDEVVRRGIGLPLLIRFSDILKSRVVDLHEAFKRAMTEYGYKGDYRGVYPIKVNQNRYVVEEITQFGRPYHYGLEAGSKPELLAVMGILDDEDALIVCNGYKDEEYIETALMCSKLGRKVLIVVEKFSELELIANTAKKIGVRPRIGMRIKLASKGSGRWEGSGGDRSKFGLSTREWSRPCATCGEVDMLSCFELIHFHLGSQISAIRAVKNAMREAGRFFVEIVRLGAPLKYFDAGGGLGVDYDGSQTNFASSMNYTLQEYANDLVFSLQEICDAAAVTPPTIVTESGRAVVAHHSMLVVDALGVGEFDVGKAPDKLPDNASRVVRNLFDTWRDISTKNVREAYHDALEYREEALSLFLARQPVAARTRGGRGHLLGHLPEDPQAGARHARSPRGVRGSRTQSVGHLLLQFLHVPVAARHLGHRPAVPHHAHPSPRAKSPRGGRCWPTSPATRTARSTTSSTGATSRTCSSCTR
jgi:arginine decarboxylase